MPNKSIIKDTKESPMIIQNSLRLLEQLSELEVKIQKIEALMDELGINEDREKIIRLILNK
jgi:hypothetical protein